ncbi:hypothetical protein SDJN03_24398, partial [Cucurbita argyrosperma subsp. sororia]
MSSNEIATSDSKLEREVKRWSGDCKVHGSGNSKIHREREWQRGEVFVSKGNETACEVEAIGSENNALALKIVFSRTGLAKNFPRVIG